MKREDAIKFIKQQSLLINSRERRSNKIKRGIERRVDRGESTVHQRNRKPTPTHRPLNEFQKKYTPNKSKFFSAQPSIPTFNPKNNKNINK